MPSFVVKVAPDADAYVVWSTIVAAPTAWGTRDEIAAYLLDDSPLKAEYAHPSITERFDRADATGTSAYDPRNYGWDDDGFIFAQRGWLPRARLAEFLASFDPDAETFDETLLEPFEDEVGGDGDLTPCPDCDGIVDGRRPSARGAWCRTCGGAGEIVRRRAGSSPIEMP